MAYTGQPSPAEFGAALKAIGSSQPTMADYLTIQSGALAGDEASQARWAAICLADPAASLAPAVTKAFGSGAVTKARKSKRVKASTGSCDCCPHDCTSGDNVPDLTKTASATKSRSRKKLYSGNRALQAQAIDRLVTKGTGRGAALTKAASLVDPDDDSDPGLRSFLKQCAAAGNRSAASLLSGLD